MASSLIRGLEQPNTDQLRQFSLQQSHIAGQGSNETATFVQVTEKRSYAELKIFILSELGWSRKWIFELPLKS
jgi:hypothetical protein